MWLYSPVCVGPGPKPRRPVFSQRGSYTRHSKSRRVIAGGGVGVGSGGAGFSLVDSIVDILGDPG